MLNSIGAVITKIDGLVWGWWLIILLLDYSYLHDSPSGDSSRGRRFQKVLSYLYQKILTQKARFLQFGALTTALAATIGTGNIIGVGTAIAGGPGAVLWCWLTGVFGIATKYSES